MEKQIKEAFDSMEMEESCVRRIEQAMAWSRPSPARRWRPAILAAVCLVLAAGLLSSPLGAQAADMVQEQIQRIQRMMDIGKYVDWLETEDGRLYFTANGEHLDITDQISEDTPFTYVQTRGNGRRTCYIVGGVYSTDYWKWSLGWEELELMPPYDQQGFLEGAGSGMYDREGYYRDWYVKAMEELDLLWRIHHGELREGGYVPGSGTEQVLERLDPADQPQWLEFGQQRLYFTANGEYLDITDQISEDTPFAYTYDDAEGVRHHVAVGGVYSGSEAPITVGWAEWLQQAPYGDGDWLGGTVCNERTAAGGYVPWLSRGAQMHGLPWSYPAG